MTTTNPKKKAKIQIDKRFLPPENHAAMLQRNILTLAYWETSYSWYDRPNAKPMNVGDALTMLNPLSSAESLNLVQRSSELKDKIIAFGPRRRMTKKEKKELEALALNSNGPNNLGTRIYVI